MKHNWCCATVYWKLISKLLIVNRRHNINLLFLCSQYFLGAALLIFGYIYCLLAEHNNNIATNTLRLIAALVSARPTELTKFVPRASRGATKLEPCMI